MVSILNKSLESLSNPYRMMTENITPTVREWPLMSSPLPTIGIVGLYLYFCLSLGPNLMKNRKPLELEQIMIGYNAIQMVINMFLLYKSFFEGMLSPEFSFIVDGTEYADTHWIYVYYYFLNKLLDLVDTVFMVLRKKESQITFLHLYHHCMMCIAGWVFVAYIGPAICVPFGIMNTFVHTVMYFYYLLTAVAPEYKKSVWWKRHLTQLQLGQFIAATIHALANVLSPSSQFPKKGIVAVFVPQGVIMFVLFMDYYRKEYKKKKHTE